MNDADISHFAEPVFKGLIDPPTILGIPMTPFLLLTVGGIEIGIAGFLIGGLGFVTIFLILYVFAFNEARAICANDVQRMRQTILKLQIRWGQGASRKRWGAVSYGPASTRGAR